MYNVWSGLPMYLGLTMVSRTGVCLWRAWRRSPVRPLPPLIPPQTRSVRTLITSAKGFPQTYALEASLSSAMVQSICAARKKTVCISTMGDALRHMENSYPWGWRW